ncbi:probable methyltransferase PMT26 [Asparagus officinalis]|uniref:probable methyltransferase PMT26 n=1 Tax=Asparagus officinalis TaxID=4686 RepID=UPI00098DEF91|nr:probable methyltransferase PMT26 [Asparagus officinalis]
MAIGRSPRMDRTSSSWCSTATIVMFVSLCLVGVWMMTSTTVVPVDLAPAESNKSEMNEQVPVDVSKTSEDKLGDAKEDSTAGDNNSNHVDQNVSENTNEKSEEKTQEESSPTVTEHKKDDSGESQTSQNSQNADGNSEGRDTNTEGGETNGQDMNLEQNSEGTPNGEEQGTEEKKLEQEEKSEENMTLEEKGQGETDEKTGETQTGSQAKEEVFPDGAQSEILKETNSSNGAWKTQASESKNEKEVQQSSSKGQIAEYSWKLCKAEAGADYIPCLDNVEAVRKLRSTKHYEHRERHCPEEGPTCLVPLPEGYQRPIKWPNSRNKVWYHNVPHTKLVEYKGHQNWVKVSGEYLTFPGGGTQFKHGALHYIDKIQEGLPDIAWGKRSRVVLDVGCGVASFGGFLFDRDVLTMSFAPKDEHEAQVQFALERGIPAISAVMGTQRLPFPSRVYDVIHCARCRVPWHIEGGMLLLELNRLLRPGGYFVWSATPVYRNLPEDVGIMADMNALTKSMCWKMVKKTKDSLNQVGLAIYRKPTDNNCYEKRAENSPPLCEESDDPNAAWNVHLQACMHRVPVNPAVRGSQWPEQWPERLGKTPYWLNNSQTGVYGKPAPEDFEADYEHWKRVVSKSYLNGMGIDWSTVRNVMDMRSIYGGFAAALRDMKVWVMNVVSIDSPDTLPVIFERGLFGIYHDWCESFSTYPRTYDLLHADHLFSRLKKRCKILPVIAEVDRVLRPEGKLIIRDNVETIREIENMAKSLHWEVRMTYAKENEGLLCIQKTMWRPQEVEASL